MRRYVMQSTDVQESMAAAGPPALLPEHLVGTPDPSWAFWRAVFLRGSGFDARLVDELADPACADAADELLAGECAFDDARQTALTRLGCAIDCAPAPARKPLVRALRQLRAGVVPELTHLIPETARLDLLGATARRDELRRRYSAAFDRAAADTAERIKVLAADPRFREAVLLQNARAFGHVRHVLSQAALANRGVKARQALEFVANHIQRYCLKNDTIGFFGPVGWATFDAGSRGITVQPGPALVARTSVHFEQWVIEALADQIIRDPSYAPWLRPRLLPLFHVDTDARQLHLPNGARVGLGPLDVEILRRCDGAATARRIAIDVVDRGVPGAASAEDVYSALHRLVARRTVCWSLELPFSSHPERALRDLLEAIDQEPLGRRALAPLDDLERGRDAVRQAVGDPDRLSEALGALDTTFERITGQCATRACGKMYAGRTLVYTDCERDARVRIGSDVVEALIRPLALVLKSARWLTHHVAACYREAFDRIYRELAPAEGGAVDLTRFWTRAHPILIDPGTRALDAATAEFRRRWGLILNVAPEQRHVHLSSAELGPAVDRLFDAPRAGWDYARYHSPDVLIAARDAEAIARGEYFAVLGELHLATHTICSAFALAQHPAPEQLQAAIDADSSVPGVTPVTPRTWPRATGRTSLALVPRQSRYFEASPDTVAPGPRSRVLSIASLVVDRTPAGLRVRTRDGRVAFDIIEFFGQILSMVTIDVMKELHAGPHVPRITVDKVVMKRESWTVRADTLDFLDLAEEQERYLRLRAWRQAMAFPRRVFVGTAVETKPFYIDFASPIYGEILIKALRRVRAHAVPPLATFSEMLPTPDQLWLGDAGGRLYTSELRIVARDLLA